MICKKCGSEIPENSTFCNTCGEPVAADSAQSAKKKNKKPLAIIIVASAVVLALGLSCLFIIPAIQKEMFHRSLLGSWVVTGTDGDMIIFLEDKIISNDGSGVEILYKVTSKSKILIELGSTEMEIKIEINDGVMRYYLEDYPESALILYKQ